MRRGRPAFLMVIVLSSLGLGASWFGASCNRNNVSGSTGGGSTEPPPDRPPPRSTAPEVTSVPDLDLSSLSAREKERFWAVANDQFSPCGDPHSVAVCARDRLCPTCLRALKFISLRIRDGFPNEILGSLVTARYARDSVARVNAEGAPVRGVATAPVTLIEFSDYECPHCARAAPVLREIEREFGERLKVIHMHFPITGHLHALPASKAAIAAGRQGKFWEMHDLLFENQSALEPQNLESYAQRLGLDMAKFKADIAAADVDSFIQANRREGERLGVDSTPTIYINGRKYPGDMPIERLQLREWIQEDIDYAR